MATSAAGLLNSLWYGSMSFFHEPTDLKYTAYRFLQLSSQTQKKRKIINATLSELVRLLKKKYSDDAAVNCTAPDNAIIHHTATLLCEQIKEYKHIKNQILRLYQNYCNFSDSDKIEYWRLVTGDDVNSTILEVFSTMNELLFTNDNKRFNNLDIDFFMAFHSENGRKVITQFVTLCKNLNIEFHVIASEIIGIGLTAKPEYTVHHVSAKTGWDQTDRNKRMDMDAGEFLQKLVEQMIPGSPERLANITLMYNDNMSFLHTINEDNQATAYLAESYVSVFLHELSHAIAFLKGDGFCIPADSVYLPYSLMHYDTLEEYLNISARETGENKLDPLNIQRCGHRGHEFNMAELNIEKILNELNSMSLLVMQSQVTAEIIARESIKRCGGWQWTPEMRRPIEEDSKETAHQREKAVSTLSLRSDS